MYCRYLGMNWGLGSVGVFKSFNPPPPKKNTFLASTILTVDYKKSVD